MFRLMKSCCIRYVSLLSNQTNASTKDVISSSRNSQGSSRAISGMPASQFTQELSRILHMKEPVCNAQAIRKMGCHHMAEVKYVFKIHEMPK